ncbi:HAMP domain-containing protein [Leisingera sp. S132]|uniref:adenylate/guanylate cyclase domain-containing protein n=1 Tax=Leisingera sp. S132 TaxID=2867016 RepID=UPI0021A2E798|nr:adenylate/guanylate cyclase domain-containing protein [Leisingera sp. S132]UWQ77913.1 HAMP domain-containing protein [Leisingera sp. S132]
MARLTVSLRYKLLAAFLTGTGLLIVLALLGLQSLQQANERTRQLIRDQERIGVYNRVYQSSSDAMAFALHSILERPGRMGVPSVQALNETQDLSLLLAHAVRRMDGEESPEGRQMAELRTEAKILSRIAFDIVNSRNGRDFTAVHDLVERQFIPKAQRLQRSAYTTQKEIVAEMNLRAQETARAYERARALVAGASAAAVLLSLLAGYAISSSVLWPVAQIGRTLSAVASGNFTARATVSNRDEFGRLARNVNSMSRELGALYEEVNAQKEELQSWNSQLERKVAQQVAELERTNRLRGFLPEQVAAMIVNAGSGSTLLNSQRRTVTVLFADLRGFTALASAVAPEQVIAALNAFHQTAGPLIEKASGTLERFLGDGLLVLFNAPLPCEDPAKRALALAKQMQTAFPDSVKPFQTGGSRIGLGIGIATGEATLGQFGFEGGSIMQPLARHRIWRPGCATRQAADRSCCARPRPGPLAPACKRPVNLS